MTRKRKKRFQVSENYKNLIFIVGLISALVLLLFFKFKRITKNDIIGPIGSVMLGKDKNQVAKTQSPHERLVVDDEIREIYKPLDPSISWVTFVSNNLLEVKYPSSWQTGPYGQHFQQGSIFNATIWEDCGEQYCPGASVAINPVYNAFDPVDYISSLLSDGWEEISDVYWVKVGNYKYLHYIGTSMGAPYDHYIYPDFDNDSVYKVSLYGYWDEKYESVLYQILSSLTWK